MKKSEIKSSRLIIACDKAFRDMILKEVAEVTHGEQNFSAFARMSLLREVRRVKKELGGE